MSPARFIWMMMLIGVTSIGVDVAVIMVTDNKKLGLCSGGITFAVLTFGLTAIDGVIEELKTIARNTRK